MPIVVIAAKKLPFEIISSEKDSSVMLRPRNGIFRQGLKRYKKPSNVIHIKNYKKKPNATLIKRRIYL